MSGRRSDVRTTLLQRSGIIGQQQKATKKVNGVPQSQTAALPTHHEEEETDKPKQAQIKQT